MGMHLFGEAYTNSACKNPAWNCEIPRWNFIDFFHRHVCITGYLLGLGDRHASNTLISLTNGKSIAIDFGYSFGSAFMLAIPELVPFRFTPMIQGLMYPFKDFGLFKDAMVSMLQKLQVTNISKLLL